MRAAPSFPTLLACAAMAAALAGCPGSPPANPDASQAAPEDATATDGGTLPGPDAAAGAPDAGGEEPDATGDAPDAHEAPDAVAGADAAIAPGPDAGGGPDAMVIAWPDAGPSACELVNYPQDCAFYVNPSGVPGDGTTPADPLVVEEADPERALAGSCRDGAGDRRAHPQAMAGAEQPEQEHGGELRSRDHAAFSPPRDRSRHPRQW